MQRRKRREAQTADLRGNLGGLCAILHERRFADLADFVGVKPERQIFGDSQLVSVQSRRRPVSFEEFGLLFDGFLLCLGRAAAPHGSSVFVIADCHLRNPAILRPVKIDGSLSVPALHVSTSLACR